MRDPKIRDPEIKDPEIKDPEIKDPKIRDPEIKDPEIKDPEILCRSSTDLPSLFRYSIILTPYSHYKQHCKGHPPPFPMDMWVVNPVVVAPQQPIALHCALTAPGGGGQIGLELD
eukprot:sb/3476770/